jgi:hypothetical protein
LRRPIDVTFLKTIWSSWLCRIPEKLRSANESNENIIGSFSEVEFKWNYNLTGSKVIVFRE